MTQRSYLFAKYELRAVLEAREQQIQQEINVLADNEILSTSEAALCDLFEEKYRVTVPHLKDLSISQDPREVQIDVSGDPMRFISDRSQPFYLTGLELSFHVPFEGDPQIFDCRASQFSSTMPQGEVRDRELILTYRTLSHDANALNKEFRAELARINQHLDWSKEQVEQFNRSLRANAVAWTSRRREKLLKDKSLVEALGFPLRRRPDAAQTYVASTVRRKPPVARAPSPSPTFRPEPTLDTKEYEHILSVVTNMVAVMERSPRAFRGMKEEDLRQHFLVQLNGQYEGQATGETFNFEGKTDILIRVEGKNIFIAECKFWDGPDSFKKAVDQLLGYASWRDTKVALLIFNRDRNLTTVLQRIPEIVKSHANFRRQVEYRSETGFRFVLHHNDDHLRELTVTVLVFEVPS